MGSLTLLAVVIESCLMVHALPIVDPGLFVIMGVQSCRDGKGYCLLGQDCSLDTDFLADDQGGHCDGLRSAFTPSAPFVCCRFSGDATTTEISPTTTDTDGMTIALPLNEEKRLEERIKPKITTKRSYDVYEEPLEVTHSSGKDTFNRSSRLDDTKKENDVPFRVELTVNGLIEDETKEYNKNASSITKKPRLYNETESYEDKTVDAYSRRNNITVPRGNMTNEPIVCGTQPRKLEERGPLTFPMCESLSSTTSTTAKENNSTANPSTDLDNQVDRGGGTIGNKGDSRYEVKLSTEISVDTTAGITELQNNDVTGSVTSRNGLSALENKDSANGTGSLSNDNKMRSNNSSIDVDSVVKDIFNLVTSLDTSSTKSTSESTTIDMNSIKETTTIPDDDLINSSVMQDTTTENVSECEEVYDGSCNDNVDDASVTVMDKGFTSEKYSEEENNSTEGSILTHKITKSAFDKESTVQTEVTQTSDIENIDSTTQVMQTSDVENIDSTTQVTQTSDVENIYSTTRVTQTSDVENIDSTTQATQTSDVENIDSTTQATQTSDVENIDSITLTTRGTASPTSKTSSTTQRATASSQSTGMSSPIQSPASSTVSSSTISSTESSTENNEKETTDNTTELSYTTDSNIETKESITSISDYNERLTDELSGNMTTESADVSTNNRDKANASVCIGGRQVTPGEECWLIQFQDSRSNITICPGALLTTNMVITSASCAIRLFNVGMEHLEVMHVDGSSTSQRVRVIIVHENYRPARSRPPRYDMGVIHLTPSLQRRQKTCVVCVAEPKMDVNVQRCRAAVRNTILGENEAQRDCKNVTPSGRRLGSVMTMCSKTSPSAPKIPSGSPLICNGMLAGVAFSWDRGQAFTPVNLFTTWIKKNQLES